jgi:hypothetical protein
MTWKHGTFGGRFARGADLPPLARTDDLVIEDLAGGDGADEVLVYDQRNDQAHCLTREAAMVWRVCDGRTRPEELAKALGFELELVNRAIAELSECELFETGPAVGLTRREATLRMAKIGGVAAAAPLIYSILAPTPALAASQAFCLNVLSCTGGSFGGQTGCDACYKAGCVCCGAGSAGVGNGVKLCTADCSCTNCSAILIHNHCTQAPCGQQSTCTAGPSGLGNFKCPDVC